MNLDNYDENVCPLCGGKASSTADGAMLAHGVRSTPISFDCPRCGTFNITYGCLEVINDPGQNELLAGMACEFQDRGEVLGINEENIASLIALAPKTPPEKAQRLLQTIARGTTSLESGITIRSDLKYPIAFVRAEADFDYLVEYLANAGMIKSNYEHGPEGPPQFECTLTLTMSGWEVVESLKAPNTQSTKAFVAMWFHDETKPAYHNGIAPAVRSTGYDPIRVDLVEHSDRGDDRMIAEIKESRFMVADFTGHRGGVYYEAGFARGLGLPVIWTCRKDHLNDMHFDIRQYNAIDWTTEGELRERLENRIRAVVGRNPRRVPMVNAER